MGAYISRPTGDGPHPAMIVFQEALGVNAQLRGVADRLGAEGFIAIAPDLYHRTSPGFESSVLDFTVLTPFIQSIKTEGLVEDARATHQWLIDQPGVQKDSICAMGFCMGSRAAYVANSELPLAAASTSNSLTAITYSLTSRSQLTTTQLPLTNSGR